MFLVHRNHTGRCMLRTERIQCTVSQFNIKLTLVIESGDKNNGCIVCSVCVCVCVCVNNLCQLSWPCTVKDTVLPTPLPLSTTPFIY